MADFFTLQNIIILSAVWLVAITIGFNFSRVKRIIIRNPYASSDIFDTQERVIYTNKWTLNIVYDTDKELDIDNLVDLTLSYEKLMSGNYSIVEKTETVHQIISQENNDLLSDNDNSDYDSNDINALNEKSNIQNTNNYIKISSIKSKKDEK